MLKTIYQAEQPVAVFVSGTHTNLAEALRADPAIAAKIAGVYVMGGSVHVPGNIKSAWPEIDNSVAEWNIWVDPLAAGEVFAAGLPLYIMPLDGTNQIRWNKADLRRWEQSGTPEARMAAQLLSMTINAWGEGQSYIWDLATAAATTDTRLCPPQPLALAVNTAAGVEQGRTVVVEGEANAQVCLQPDAAQVKARVADVLSR